MSGLSIRLLICSSLLARWTRKVDDSSRRISRNISSARVMIAIEYRSPVGRCTSFGVMNLTRLGIAPDYTETVLELVHHLRARWGTWRYRISCRSKTGDFWAVVGRLPAFLDDSRGGRWIYSHAH